MNYQKTVSVKDLADLVEVSKSYLCYIFKKETGKTITDYYNEIRIREAEKFLQETNRSVKQICSEIGFTDQNYFSRLFKKVVGISPLQYRKQR